MTRIFIITLLFWVAVAPSCFAWWSWSPPGEHSTHHQISDAAMSLVTGRLTTDALKSPEWLASTYTLTSDAAAHGGSDVRNGGDIDSLFASFLSNINDGNMAVAATYLGYCVHLIEDMHVPAHAFNIKHSGLDTGAPDMFESLASDMVPSVSGIILPTTDALHTLKPTSYYDEAKDQTTINVAAFGFSGYFHRGNRGGIYADWNGDGPKGYYTNELGIVYESLDFDLFPGTHYTSGHALIQNQLNEAARVTGLFLLAVDKLLSYTPTTGEMPLTGHRGTTFVLTGSGFVPLGTVTVHIVNPDGVEAPPVTVTVDASAHFSLDFVTTSATMPGRYSWWTLDNANGKKSTTLTFDVTVPPETALLTIHIEGTGAGAVTINPVELSTNSDTSVQLVRGTEIRLHADPAEYALFSGWSGQPCSGTEDCSFTFTEPLLLTATFDLDVEHQIRLERVLPMYFQRLADAVAAAIPGETIQLWGVTFDEVSALEKTITIRGGYTAGYTDNSGRFSYIKAPLVIGTGSLTLENVMVR